MNEHTQSTSMGSRLRSRSSSQASRGLRARAQAGRSAAKKAAIGLSVAGLALAGSLASTTAASASVNGCAQGWSQYHGVCIYVTTGGKNTSNHTQWVSQISVQMADAPGSKIEAWAGNGPTGVAWYRSQNGVTSVTWPINQWIKTKSGICGAYTYPGTSDRSIACITITA
jgi:hypothetical protein